MVLLPALGLHVHSADGHGALVSVMLGSVLGPLQEVDSGRACMPACISQCCRGVGGGSLSVNYWAGLGEAADRLMGLGSYPPSTCWVLCSVPGCVPPPLSFAGHYLSSLVDEQPGSQLP